MVDLTDLSRRRNCTTGIAGLKWWTWRQVERRSRMITNETSGLVSCSLLQPLDVEVGLVLRIGQPKRTG